MKHNNFDFNQLIAFVAVAELESFKLAAEKVFISPPALSRRIEKLESSLGVRLFNRTTREVKLTPIGKSFYEKVKGALDDLELTALNIKDIADTYVSHITIACIPSVIDQFLLEPLNQLIKNYPKMKIRILDGSELSVIDHVQNGKVDFVCNFSPSSHFGEKSVLFFCQCVGNTTGLKDEQDENNWGKLPPIAADSKWVHWGG